MTDEEKHDWTKEQTFILIQEIENHPEVWDVQNPDYKNKTKKNEIFRCIAEQFPVSPREIIRKWHNLKTQYVQECKKSRKLSASGNSSAESRWPFFQSLKFNDCSISVRNKPYLETIELDDYETGAADITIIKNPAPLAIAAQPRQAKRKAAENDDLLFKVNRLLRTSPAATARMDPFQVFGEYVAGELKALKNEKNQKRLKRMILKCIIEVSEVDEELSSEKDSQM